MKLEEKIFQELKDNKMSIEELNDQYFIDSQHEIEVENISKLLNENSCSFQEIVDKFKSTKDGYSNSCLSRLLRNKEFFKELIQDTRLNTDDLRYLLSKIDRARELYSLFENTGLLNCIIDNELFKELVDKSKSIEDKEKDLCWVYCLLKNKEFFEKLIENSKLTQENVRYLLNKIDYSDELNYLCCNTSLIKYVLNEFILNKELVDRFNTLFENSYLSEKHNIHTVFGCVEYFNEYNEEILNLNELNRYTYTFDLNEDQKFEMIELIQNNEIAKNRVIQIIENHLEDTYDFETLKELLTKDDKKKKIKMNI